MEMMLRLLVADDDLLKPLDATTSDLTGNDESKWVTCAGIDQRRAPRVPGLKLTYHDPVLEPAEDQSLSALDNSEPFLGAQLTSPFIAHASIIPFSFILAHLKR